MLTKSPRIFCTLFAVLISGIVPQAYCSQAQNLNSSTVQNVQTTPQPVNTHKQNAQMLTKLLQAMPDTENYDLFDLGKRYEEAGKKIASRAPVYLALAANYYAIAAHNNEGALYYLPKFYEKYKNIFPDAFKKRYYWLVKIAQPADSVPDAAACYQVAQCHKQGLGVEKNEIRYFEWIKKAADEGSSKASYETGLCYEAGQGTAQDSKKAFAYFKRAADAFAESDELVGTTNYKAAQCFESGYGTNIDTKKAYYYYTISAKAGFPKAWYTLGFYYTTGLVVGRNIKKAFEYYLSAAQKGEIRGLAAISYLYEQGIGLSKQESYFKGCYEQVTKLRSALSQHSAKQVDAYIREMRSKVAGIASGVVLDCTGEECSTCRSAYAHNDVLAVLPCGHKFHKNCIDGWFAALQNEYWEEEREDLVATCPFCRSDCMREDTQSHCSIPHYFTCTCL